MGLDMYLNKRIYIGANYEHRNVKVTISITAGEKNETIKIDPTKISYIEEAFGYWRKANQIHKWFVDNVQGGKDECQESYVSLEQLAELLELVDAVLKDHGKAQELLPTQSGFFFGATDFDEYYFQDLEDTKDILTRAIETEEGAFYYRASW